MVDIITTGVLVVEVTPPFGPPSVLIPIGAAGPAGGPGEDGTDGNNGWTPVLALVMDGVRVVERVIDWLGGQGTKPATGLYVSTTGFTPDVAAATNIRGSTGLQGAKGDKGEDGKILVGGGANILDGNGPPSDAIGNDGDLYLDNLSGDVYGKDVGHWVLNLNIKGPKGDQGVKGDDGDIGIQGPPGNAGGDGAPGAKGDKGDKGDDGDKGDTGNAGAAGATIHMGTGVPGAGLGAVFDLYVDSATFTLYDKTSPTNWHSNGTLRGLDGTNGDDGADGADGAGIHFGVGAPVDPGQDEDIWVDTATFNVYQYDISDNTWTLKGNTKGPKGDKGDKGDPGDDGADGSTGAPGADGTNGTDGDDGTSITFGTANPTGALAANITVYYQTVSQHIWTRAAGIWTDAGSLKGAPGTDGTNGADGAPGTPGTPGTNGTDAALTFASKSANYTLVIGDANNGILHPAADTTARQFTIPPNGSVPFLVGTAITFINEHGAGLVTISITTDTMRLAGSGATGSRTLAADGVCTAIKVTSTSWIIAGTGLS